MEHAVYAEMYRQEKVLWWYRGMNRIGRMLLSRYVPRKGIRILDAGCGTGGNFDTLREFGKVTGIDTSEEALRFAKERGRAELVQGSIKAMPFAGRTFDLVNCTDVLYHREVGNDGAALREFSRVLTEDGLLYLREPAYNWLRGKHDTLVWTKWRYTRPELHAKVEAAGFDVLFCSYANCLLFPLAVLVRTAERLWPGRSTDPDTLNPPRFLNTVFAWIFGIESVLLRRIRFPFGLSIALVAKKRK